MPVPDNILQVCSGLYTVGLFLFEKRKGSRTPCLVLIIYTSNILLHKEKFKKVFTSPIGVTASPNLLVYVFIAVVEKCWFLSPAILHQCKDRWDTGVVSWGVARSQDCPPNYPPAFNWTWTATKSPTRNSEKHKYILFWIWEWCRLLVSQKMNPKLPEYSFLADTNLPLVHPVFEPELLQLLQMRLLHGGGSPRLPKCWPLARLMIGALLHCRGVVLFLRHGTFLWLIISLDHPASPPQ